MIFADINLLNISINLLLIIFVIVCLLMSLIILMQRPKQEGLGAAFGGGVTDQVFGARTTNVLQKGTVYLGSMFFILALTLAILIGKQTKHKSLIDPHAKEQSAKKPQDGKTAVTPKEVPKQPKSLVEELPAVVTPAPVAEKAPAPVTPVVPAPVVNPPDAGQGSSEVPVPPPADENKANKHE